MDQTTLPLRRRLFHKFEDPGDLHVLLVEQHLLVILLPVERQVLDPYRLPEVGYLVPGTVHDVRDFVGDQELQVLQGETSL